MRPGWKWVAAMSVLVLGIVVSVSGAATSGSKRDGGSGSSRNGNQLRAPMPPPGEHLSTLASELGVSQDRLREALEAVREDLGPRRRTRRAQRPTRAQMEKRCNEITDALAKELDKNGEDVRAAMKAAAKKDIEKAVDAERLTRSQADQILSRIDDSACVPAFRGLKGPGGCGDGPHGGPPGPPPGESGSQGSQGSSVAPAPLGAPA